MFASPLVIAVVALSLMTTAFIVYATGVGIRILLSWDPTSSSEAQLLLERKTYLVSSILAHVIAVQLLAVFLFVAVADHLHTYFTGAMCAAGTLNLNAFGYPTLGLKVAGLIGGGIWLVLHRLDRKAPDYPLIRVQYGWLGALCLVWVAETIVLIRFFALLDPQIITSCCGTLFNESTGGLAAELAHPPESLARGVFFVVLGLTMAAGGVFLLSRSCAWLFSALGALMLPVSLAALVSFLCLYIYQLPTHHCPFCLLQREYAYVGYLLYSSLFLGSVTAMGVGVAHCFGRGRSLSEIVPKVQRRLCITSMIAYLVFGVTAVYPMVSSDFRL